MRGVFTFRVSLAPKIFQRDVHKFTLPKICPSSLKNPSYFKKKGKLTIQCDELWSFVDNKGNKQWVWLALDADTREIVGVHIGGWRETGAQKFLDSFPTIFSFFVPLHSLIFGQPMSFYYLPTYIMK